MNMNGGQAFDGMDASKQRKPHDFEADLTDEQDEQFIAAMFAAKGKALFRSKQFWGLVSHEMQRAKPKCNSRRDVLMKLKRLPIELCGEIEYGNTVQMQTPVASVLRTTPATLGLSTSVAVTHSHRIAEVLKRLDWKALVQAAENMYNVGHKTVKSPLRTINAGLKELLLSGKDVAKLLKISNPRDNNKAYEHVIHELLEASKMEATAVLKQKHEYRDEDIDLKSFTQFSIIYAINLEQSGQVPHLDSLFGNAQFFVALSRDCSPTNVLKTRTNLKDGASLDDHVKLLAKAKEPLGWGLEKLLSHMESAHDKLMQPGDMLSMSGPIVHCAPPTSNEEERAVLFFTSTMEGFKPYDNGTQIMPWVYYADAEHGVKDLGLFCETCRQWAAFKPWENYKLGPFRNEVEKICKGKIHSMTNFFYP